MSPWLPDDIPPVDLSALEWWQPAAVAEWFGDTRDWHRLSYIVVDELHEGVAGLVIAPWPRMDSRGRLHFGDEESSTRIATPAAALLSVLQERRLPIVPVAIDPETIDELSERKIAIGDVFAARVLIQRALVRRRGPPNGGTPAHPGSWLEGEVLDITAEATEMAKAQAAAAAAGVLDEQFLLAVEKEFGEDEGPQDTTPEGTPSPTGSGSSGDSAAPVPEPAAPEQKAAARQAAQEEDKAEEELRETEEELREIFTRHADVSERKDDDQDEGVQVKA